MPDVPLVAAVVGNGRVLGNLNQKGELTHLYWPHIDYPNHVQRVLAGVHVWGLPGVYWLSDHHWQYRQRHVSDAPIVETVAECAGLNLSVILTDLVTPCDDTLVRRYQVRNDGTHPTSITFLYYAAFHLGESWRYNSVYWVPEAGALAYYRRDTAIVVGGARGPTGYKVGARPYDNSAWNDAQDGHLCGGVIEMNDVDGALAWESGTLEPGATWQITVYMSMDQTVSGALAALAAARGQGAGALEKITGTAWEDWLQQSASLCNCTGKAPDTSSFLTSTYMEVADNLTETEEINTQAAPSTATNDTKSTIGRLWRRSLVTMRLMTDEAGGIIAAPEFDPERRGCGGYGYCWGRDAAYIVYALDVARRHDLTASFYYWAARTQEPSGVWYQRYWVTGELAPSWGLIQLDETGSILWGLYKHIAFTGNKGLLSELWPNVERAAEFLVNFRDAETGLPKPSWDLWEERNGIHTYSCAAAYGGLHGAASLARQMGKNAKARYWAGVADDIKAAVEHYCWSDTHGRFLRSLDLRVPAWTMHDPSLSHRVQQLPPPPGHLYGEYAVPEDATVDSSLLGLVTPFGMFAANDPRIISTVTAIERDLTQSPSGGVIRYTGDHYRGGNPWIICTLWLAQYHLASGNRQRALDLFNWAVQHRTGLDLFPEQVDRATGLPAWVVPLTWSHAMFMLTAAELGRS